MEKAVQKFRKGRREGERRSFVAQYCLASKHANREARVKEANKLSRKWSQFLSQHCALFHFSMTPKHVN